MESGTDTPDAQDPPGEPDDSLAETIPAEVNVQRELGPGALAFDTVTGGVWLVVGVPDTTAAECSIDPGGTLAEWLGCPEDDTVFYAVAIATLRSKPDRFESFDDVAAAVREERLLHRALPASRVAPLPVGAVASYAARRER